MKGPQISFEFHFCAYLFHSASGRLWSTRQRQLSNRGVARGETPLHVEAVVRPLSEGPDTQDRELGRSWSARAVRPDVTAPKELLWWFFIVCKFEFMIRVKQHVETQHTAPKGTPAYQSTRARDSPHPTPKDMATRTIRSSPFQCPHHDHEPGSRPSRVDAGLGTRQPTVPARAN